MLFHDFVLGQGRETLISENNISAIGATGHEHFSINTLQLCFKKLCLSTLQSLGWSVGIYLIL